MPTVSQLQHAAHQNAIDKGWWDAQRLANGEVSPVEAERTIPEKIALLHSELSEALEEFRNGRGPNETYLVNDKPEGFPIELADVAIRLFDLCGALGIDLALAIEAKMLYNANRPHRHGGKRV